MRARFPALALMLVVVAMASCSRGPKVTLLSEKDLPSGLYAPPDRPDVDPRSVRATIYFVRTDARGNLVKPEMLAAVSREGRSSVTTVEFVMRALLEGVTGEEGVSGFRSAIPPGTELLGVSVRNGLADVNLSAGFEDAGAEILNLLRVAQVVWTLTELDEVDVVRFRIHGATQPVIDQLGVAHDRVGRGRYSRLGPREGDEPDIAPGPAPNATPSATPTP